MSENEFVKSLVDGSQMVSLVLVFLSVLFGIKYQRIVTAINREIPDTARSDERTAFRDAMSDCIKTDVLAIAVPSVVLALLLGPANWRIVTHSSLSYVHLDLVRTLFIAVELFIIAGAAWSVRSWVRLLRRKSRAR